MAITSSTLSFGGFTVRDGHMTMSPEIQGIDFQEIVDALVEVQLLKATSDNEEISKLGTQLSALSELQTYTQTLQDKAAALRNPLTYTGLSNLFQQKVVSAQSNTSTAASQIISAIATQSARTGTYAIQVNRIAQSDMISSSVGETSSSVAMAGVAGGTLTINGENITVPATPTLSELETLINNVSADSGVAASVIKLTDTDYRLNLVATETGTPITLSDSTAGALLTSLNLAVSGETTNSLSAELEYNNLTVYRTSNTISDLITGMTLELINESPATTVQLIVENDVLSIKEAIEEFVEAYNEFNAFVLTQMEVDIDGEVDYEASPLFNNHVMRLVSQGVLGSIGNNARGINFDDLTSLAGIGISFDDDNNLVIDDDTLNDVLVSDIAGVRKLFGFDFDQSNYSINVSETPTSLSSSLIDSATGEALPITVIFSLAMDGVTYSATLQAGATLVSATIDANLNIIGPDGTIFEDFQFTYDGATLAAGGSVTTVFTPSQGIADQLYNYLNAHLDSIEGTFLHEIDFITDRRTTAQTRVDEITEKAERERTRLTRVYAKIAAMYAQMEADIMQIQMYTSSLYQSR